MQLLLENVTKMESQINHHIPLRTVLYNLEPIGLGTPYIESLTSYISRLAINHNVHVSTLINKVIGPNLQKSYLAEKFSNGLVPIRYSLINGISTINIEFVEALERLTGRNDIQHMSFKNWEGIFSVNIVTNKRRWCPVCLEQWKKESKEIYEPLIWLVSQVDKCEIHEVKLKDQCPNCKKELSFNHRNFLVGYCQYCSTWLGERESSIKKEPLSDYELFIMCNYKQMLELGSNLTSFPSKSFFCFLLPKLKENLGFKEVLDLARFLDVRYMGLIDWMKNRHSPNPDAIMSICHKVNKTIYDLFLLSEKQVDLIDFNHQIVVKEEVSKEEIKMHLLKHLDSVNPKSLEQICQELGVTQRVARWHFPELSQKISGNYSAYTKHLELTKRNRINEILEMCIKKDIPESLKKYLKDHDISYKAARKANPDLCKLISERYLEFISENKNKRLIETKAKIKMAMHELNNEGIYPSVPQIAQRLYPLSPNIFRQKVFNEFRKAILLKLGYDV